MTGRQAALSALKKVRTEKEWPEKYIRDIFKGSDPREESLALALTFSVIKNMRLIDYYLSKVSSIPLKKITPIVLDILRIGVCQLAFMDKIPANAAVSECVELTKKTGNLKAAGFCNAVLRKLTVLPEPPDDPAVLYSHLDWFYDEIKAEVGESGALRILMADNDPFLYTARVNTLKTDTASLISSLSEKGIKASALPWPRDSIEFDSIKNIFDTSEHRDGLFYVQDTAAQAAVLALSPVPESRVLDLCAAPGGKSVMCAQLMDNRGLITAVDPQEKKLSAVSENAERMGVDIIEPLAADGRMLPGDIGEYDFVLCDVPCSGTGVIRKKPEIRLKTKEELMPLGELQSALLSAGFEKLKKGGTLVYSTCSILGWENSGIVDDFLKKNKNAALVPMDFPEKEGRGMVTFYQGIDRSDGFFIAKLMKL